MAHSRKYKTFEEWWKYVQRFYPLPQRVKHHENIGNIPPTEC